MTKFSDRYWIFDEELGRMRPMKPDEWEAPPMRCGEAPRSATWPCVSIGVICLGCFIALN